jgi:hypothetical protein
MKYVILLLPFLGSAADIPQGAHVLLRMENSVSTRTAKEGDFVYLRTAFPIANAGDIAVPAGSYVQGVVSMSKQSGRVKGRAQLAIRLETLTLASGKVYKFSPHLSSVDSGDSGQKVEGSENTVEQAPGHGQDAERIAILAGSGAAMAAWRSGVGRALELVPVWDQRSVSLPCC